MRSANWIQILVFGEKILRLSFFLCRFCVVKYQMDLSDTSTSIMTLCFVFFCFQVMVLLMRLPLRSMKLVSTYMQLESMESAPHLQLSQWDLLIEEKNVNETK